MSAAKYDPDSLANLAPFPVETGERPAAGHVVRFFESDDALVKEVSRYLAVGLENGEPVVAIATAPHTAALLATLESRGVDVAAAVAERRLTFLDAEATLASLLSGPLPLERQFFASIGAVLSDASRRGKGRSPRAYGEMVDLLAAAGNVAAAERLEELWNVLARTHDFSLLCTYSLANFSNASDQRAFRALCDAHTDVYPSERAVLPEEGTRWERQEIALLQQRARSLEAEIARREALERERERLVEDLKRTVHLTEMFVGVLGHDLRNPLAAIMTSAGFLLRRNDAESLGKPVGRILTAAERMARMIDQLLDFTRIRLGQGLTLEPRATDLDELTTATIEELETATGTSAIRTARAGDLRGTWDPDRISQLLGNLAGNALRHRSTSTPVSITLDGRGETTVTVTLRNEGAIPDDLLPVIFEPFHGRREKALGPTRGLGLGLFISREIVAAHGGTLEVASEEGVTAFSVTLPRHTTTRAAEGAFRPV